MFADVSEGHTTSTFRVNDPLLPVSLAYPQNLRNVDILILDCAASHPRSYPSQSPPCELQIQRRQGRGWSIMHNEEIHNLDSAKYY
jgi:hypothetical protein